MGGLFQPAHAKENTMEHYVFVYGTLRKGYWNHHFLKDCQRVGDTWETTRPYCMGKHGTVGFPMARKPSKNIAKIFEAHEVIGEVYVCNDETMAELDFLEGNGKFYKREKVIVKNAEGEALEAWMYFYLGRLKKHDMLPIPSGDWVKELPTYVTSFIAYSA